jgi:transcriptional regulator with XRE-family HTH domain
MSDKSPERNDEDQPKRAARHLARNLISLRHARSLTQDALAAASGLPRSTIANLESGEGNPSLAVLVKIAHALNAPIDELIAAPHAKVRKWASREVGLRVRGRGVEERPLVPEPMPEELLIVMDFAPDAVMSGTPHLPGTREYFTCLEGEVRIVVAGKHYDLTAGDVLAFPGNIPHSYQNSDTRRRARGVSVVIFAKAGV